MNFFTKDRKKALEAKATAQWIAFGPVIFQVARVLRNSGILAAVENSGTDGLTLEEIAAKSKPVAIWSAGFARIRSGYRDGNCK